MSSRNWGAFASYLEAGNVESPNNESKNKSNPPTSEIPTQLLQSSAEHSVTRVSDNYSATGGSIRDQFEGIPNETIRQIASGNSMSLALLASGDVWSWGNREAKEDEAKLSKHWELKQTPNLRQVISIACGNEHYCAITNKPFDNLFSWGINTFGQLGIGSTKSKAKPVAVMGELTGKCVTHVSCGGEYTMCVTQKGQLYSWGRNNTHQLGLNSSEAYVTTPTYVREFHKHVLQRSNENMLNYKSKDDQTIEASGMYRQLMISTGQQHAFSWIAESGNEFLNLSQKEHFHRLEKNNTILQQKVHSLEEKVRSLQESLETLEQQQLDGLTRTEAQQRTFDRSKHGNNDSYQLPTTVSPKNQATSLVKNRVVDRDLQQDAILSQVSKVLQFTSTKCQEEDAKIALYDSEINQLHEELDRVGGIVRANKERVQQMNYKVNLERMELAALSHTQNSQETTRSTNVLLDTNSQNLYAQCKTRLENAMSLAKAGEQGIAIQLQDLNSSKANLDQKVLRRADCVAERSKWIAISKLLETLGAERKELLRKKHRSTARQEYESLDQTANSVLDRLRRTSLESLAHEPLVEQTLGVKDASFESLVQISDTKIDQLVAEAHSRLRRRPDTEQDVDDAASEVVATLLSAIQDVAHMRHECNRFTLLQLRMARDHVHQLAMLSAAPKP